MLMQTDHLRNRFTRLIGDSVERVGFISLRFR